MIMSVEYYFYVLQKEFDSFGSDIIHILQKIRMEKTYHDRNTGTFSNNRNTFPKTLHHTIFSMRLK